MPIPTGPFHFVRATSAVDSTSAAHDTQTATPM